MVDEAGCTVAGMDDNDTTTAIAPGHFADSISVTDSALHRTATGLQHLLGLLEGDMSAELSTVPRQSGIVADAREMSDTALQVEQLVQRVVTLVAGNADRPVMASRVG